MAASLAGKKNHPIILLRNKIMNNVIVVEWIGGFVGWLDRLGGRPEKLGII